MIYSAYLQSTLLSWHHIHPVLVHFTTALLPASLASDLFGKHSDRHNFSSAAWWMLVYGAIATPVTAIAGWLWANDLMAASGGYSDPSMAVHRWLGIFLALGILLLTVWRARHYFKRKGPGIAYLAFASLLTAALLYQGYLGGKMVFG